MRFVLYIAIAAFVVTRPQLRRVWDELGTRHRRFLGVLFGLVLLGQVVGLKYQTYPFVKWGMYSGSHDSVTYVQYRGVRADGTEAPFPIAHLVRTHSTSRAIECPTCGKRLLWRMRNFTKKLERLPPGPERDELMDLYVRTLRSGWEVYASRNAEVDFESVRVFRNRTSVSGYQETGEIESRFLWEVELR